MGEVEILRQSFSLVKESAQEMMDTEPLQSH